jgi:hypothetical protein
MKMKKVFTWIKKQIVWFTSRRVLEAINNCATFEEVEQIVNEEL